MKKLSITILIMLLFAGCSKGQSNAAQPIKEQPAQTQNTKDTHGPAVKSVTLAQLLREQKSYAGKEVEVKGIFSRICCPEDFILKDGFDTIEVVVSEMPSKSKIGSKIKVVGKIFLRGNGVSILAKEVKFE